MPTTILLASPWILRPSYGPASQPNHCNWGAEKCLARARRTVGKNKQECKETSESNVCVIYVVTLDLRFL